MEIVAADLQGMDALPRAKLGASRDEQAKTTLFVRRIEATS